MLGLYGPCGCRGGGEVKPVGTCAECGGPVMFLEMWGGVNIPRGLLERVTQAAASRDLKTPVNTWITEAILSQLKKEGF